MLHCSLLVDSDGQHVCLTTIPAMHGQQTRIEQHNAAKLGLSSPSSLLNSSLRSIAHLLISRTEVSICLPIDVGCDRDGCVDTIPLVVSCDSVNMFWSADSDGIWGTFSWFLGNMGADRHVLNSNAMEMSIL